MSFGLTSVPKLRRPCTCGYNLSEIAQIKYGQKMSDHVLVDIFSRHGEVMCAPINGELERRKETYDIRVIQDLYILKINKSRRFPRQKRSKTIIYYAYNYQYIFIIMKTNRL